MEAKQGNDLIGYSLSACLFWERLVGCLWLVTFGFLNLEVFTGIDSGSSFHAYVVCWYIDWCHLSLMASLFDYFHTWQYNPCGFECENNQLHMAFSASNKETVYLIIPFFFFRRNQLISFFIHCFQVSPLPGGHVSLFVYINHQNMEFTQNLWFLLLKIFTPTTLRELCPAVPWIVTSLMPKLVPTCLHWILNTCRKLRWKEVYKIIWGMRKPSLLAGFSKDNVSGHSHKGDTKTLLSTSRVPGSLPGTFFI